MIACKVRIGAVKFLDGDSAWMPAKDRMNWNSVVTDYLGYQLTSIVYTIQRYISLQSLSKWQSDLCVEGLGLMIPISLLFTEHIAIASGMIV